MAWKFNPFIGNFDFYESEDDMGLDVPQPYIASPTVTNLRDMLVAAGIMEAAPPVDEAIVWEDGGIVWEDEGITFEDT